ncbi:MAG: class I SAM-dependent methyltransferase [Ancalomicrobiaceae bacterium]|nr:class I SAM-dependent methyltransferase [Ancalomicrobiaceae bacterium]
MSGPNYEYWETRYTTSDYIFGTGPCAFLADCRPLLPSQGRALAIADGEGRNGVFLAECGLDVVSVDFSPVAQEKARALANERRVSIEAVTADILTWDWPEAEFDVVAAIFFQFAAPAERTGIFESIRRSLKPGGLLLLHGYRPEQLAYGTGGPGVVENLYTRALLEAHFGNFADLSIREYDRELEEGTRHVGMSALIDLVGRKPV